MHVIRHPDLAPLLFALSLCAVFGGLFTRSKNSTKRSTSACDIVRRPGFAAASVTSCCPRQSGTCSKPGPCRKSSAPMRAHSGA